MTLFPTTTCNIDKIFISDLLNVKQFSHFYLKFQIFRFGDVHYGAQIEFKLDAPPLPLKNDSSLIWTHLALHSLHIFILCWKP